MGHSPVGTSYASQHPLHAIWAGRSLGAPSWGLWHSRFGSGGSLPLSRESPFPSYLSPTPQSYLLSVLSLQPLGFSLGVGLPREHVSVVRQVAGLGVMVLLLLLLLLLWLYVSHSALLWNVRGMK